MRATPVALGLATALLAVSCSSNPSTEQGANTPATGVAPVNLTAETDAGEATKGGMLKFGLGSETDGWSPWWSRFANSGYIVGNAIYDPLFSYDEAGVPQPYLAESASSSPDFKTWTIKLRPDVTFHDGEKLDALAVKKNYDAGLGSGLVGAALATIDTVEGNSGSLEVTFNMKDPWSSFLHTLTAQLGYMQSPALLNAEGDKKPGQSEAALRKPIGTGPFKFGDWVPDKSLKVSRNDDYWRTDHEVYLDGIEFQVLPEFGSRGQSLESGTIDVMETSDPSQLIKFREKAEAKEFQMFTDDRVDGSEIFIALNTAVPPFEDKLAREVVAYGINTEELSQNAFLGEFPPARGPYSQASPYYTETNYPKFDIATAQSKHDEWKAKNGGQPLTFKAIVPPVTEYQAIAQSLQQQAAQYGVKVEIVTQDQTTLILSVLSGQYESSGFILFGSPSLDREYPFLASKPLPPGETSLNFTRLDDEALVKAMNDARSIPDTDVEGKKKNYAEVQKRMADNLNYVFLVHQRTAIVYSNTVHGLSKPTLPGGKAGMLSITPFTYEAWVKR